MSVGISIGLGGAEFCGVASFAQPGFYAAGALIKVPTVAFGG